MSHYWKDTNSQVRLIAFLNNAEHLSGEWTDRAACKDGKIDFFPKIGGSKSGSEREMEETLVRANTQYRIKRQREIAVEPLKLCEFCPVRRECRMEHLHEQYGVWWGTVPAERETDYHMGCKCMACSTRRVDRRARKSDNVVCTATPEDENCESDTG